MHDLYKQSYETLGLQPGDGWKELKIAYRRRMREWHPDRFPGNDPRKKRAEDETKAINKAYKELADYHRRHGALPLAAQPHAESRRPPRYEQPAYADTVAGRRINIGELLHAAAGRRIALLSVIAISILGVYFMLNIPSSDERGGATLRTPHPSAGGHDAHSQPPATPRHDEPFFTVGSTIGEVYAAQGVPSKTENDVWHYGNSKVYFTNGVVHKWESTSDNPLNARIDRRPDRTSSVFARGSTKSDVRQIQGTPVRESDKVWDYGISRVYFEGDRVVGWYESPLNPLQIKH